MLAQQMEQNGAHEIDCVMPVRENHVRRGVENEIDCIFPHI